MVTNDPIIWVFPILIRAHSETEVSGSSWPSPLRGEWYSFNYYLCTMEQSALRTRVWHSCGHDCSMVPLPISLAFGSYLRGPSIHIHPYPFWMKVLSVSHFGVGSTRLCRTPVLHASLSSGSTPARPHLMTSVFTHSNHVFRDFPFFLVPGIWKFVIDFIQDVARRKWPYHQSRRQQRTNLMSSMPSFSSSATTIKYRDLLVHSYV